MVAWWGRWWEQVIQMVKKLLRRVLERASLKNEELLTILCFTEAVINSRLLTYLSADSNDMFHMFIPDVPTVGGPEMDNVDRVNAFKPSKYQQRLRENLWKRFRDENLGLLV
jgi:hypothetical protein